MMKRYYKIIMILAVAAAVFLCGCNTQGKGEDEKDKKENKVSKETKALVEDMFSEEGVAKAEEDFEMEYHYNVPKLLIESEDAEEINEEIRQTIGQKVTDCLQYIEEGTIPNSLEISWELYEQNDMIFLVILDGYKEAASEYQVYGYDVKKDQRVGNKEIIESLGVTEEELLKEIKREAAQKFDQIFEKLPYDPGYLQIFYDNDLILRSQTLLGIAPESLALYLDGEMCQAVVKGYVPAGPGYFWENYEIDLNKEKKTKEKKVTDQFITAVLKENEVKITFQKTEDSDQYLSAEASGIKEMEIAYDTEYEVKGLYSDYKDMYIMSIGHGYNPYLILLTEEGHIEFANILSGAAGDQICVFPVSGIYDAVEVTSDIRAYQEEETETAAQTAIVKNKDGEEFDLMYSTVAADDALHNMLKVEATLVSDAITHYLDSGGEYSSIYFMELRENNNLIFDESLPDVGITNNYKGNYSCNGMSDDGIVYSCLIYTDEKTLYCTLAFWYSPFNETVSIKVLSGTEIFDRPGEWITMYPAFG